MGVTPFINPATEDEKVKFIATFPVIVEVFTVVIFAELSFMETPGFAAIGFEMAESLFYRRTVLTQ